MDGEKRKRAVEAPACQQSGAVATSSLKDPRKERDVTGIKKEKHGREAIRAAERKSSARPRAQLQGRASQEKQLS